MQQSIQDRTGQDFVVGQHFRPTGDAFVRRDRDRAALITMIHDAKKQIRFFAVECLIAELVDDQQRRRHVFFMFQSRGIDVLVAFELMKQLVNPREANGKNRFRSHACPRQSPDVIFLRRAGPVATSPDDRESIDTLPTFQSGFAKLTVERQSRNS